MLLLPRSGNFNMSEANQSVLMNVKVLKMILRMAKRYKRLGAPLKEYAQLTNLLKEQGIYV